MSTPKKSIPLISIESQELIKRLVKCKVGETITYEEMNKLVLGDIREDKRYALYTALKTLLRDHNMVFQTIRGEGIIRASDKEIITGAEQGLKIVHRRIGRDVKKLQVVDYDSLSKEDKIKHNARLSQLGVVYLMSSVSKGRQIEGKVEETKTKLNPNETIRLFIKE